MYLLPYLCRRAFPAVFVAGSVAVASGWAQPANAQNLVTDGSFTQLTTQASAEFGTTNNSYTPTQTVTGWTTAGYNFVYLPGTADSSGAIGQYNTTATLASPGMRLWGPNDSGASTGNTLTTIPGGGNFIAADGAYETSPITQTVNGLIVGQAYTLSFAWAAAQQQSYTTATSDLWSVSLGTVTGTNPAETTPTVPLAAEAFTSWMTQSMTFVATASSELLSFAAVGTPSGQPPFALLADVSLTKVPEPASAMLMLSGFAGLIAFARRRGARTPIVA